MQSINNSAGSHSQHSLALNDQREAYEWTLNLVRNVETILKEVVSADELKKLTIENGLPDFKKVL